MAGGIISSLPPPLKSSSSPVLENGLLQLKFGTYSPISQISEVNFLKDSKILSESAPQSTDPTIKAAIVQQASSSDSFLAQKYQDQRIEMVNLKEGLPVVSFDIGVKEQLISKVHFVIVAKFSHGRPLYRDFQSFLSSFKFRGQFVISAYDRKHVFIDFDVFDDFVKLWMTKSCVVKGYKVRFFRWTDSFSPSTENSIAPVWVSLPGLPLYFLEEEALLSIATVLGKPLYIDPLNLSRRKVGAACICIALDVSKTLPEAIWIHFMSAGKVLQQFLQTVVYHDLPPFCKGCYHLGHDVDWCKLRTGGQLNGGLEKGTHEDHLTLETQIPEAVLSQGRLYPTRDKHSEEGEIEVVTGKEGRHMNEAIQSSVTSDSRVEGKPISDTEHKERNADVDPFAPLEGIKNDEDFSIDLEQTSSMLATKELLNNKIQETELQTTKADSEEPLNQINHSRNVEGTAGHSAPSGLVATVDKHSAMEDNSESPPACARTQNIPLQVTDEGITGHSVEERTLRAVQEALFESCALIEQLDTEILSQSKQDFECPTTTPSSAASCPGSQEVSRVLHSSPVPDAHTDASSAWSGCKEDRGVLQTPNTKKNFKDKKKTKNKTNKQVSNNSQEPDFWQTQRRQDQSIHSIATHRGYYNDCDYERLEFSGIEKSFGNYQKDPFEEDSHSEVEVDDLEEYRLNKITQSPLARSTKKNKKLKNLYASD